MVVKLRHSLGLKPAMFESSVILNGSQTHEDAPRDPALFESSVILNGSQTAVFTDPFTVEFESSAE